MKITNSHAGNKALLKGQYFFMETIIDAFIFAAHADLCRETFEMESHIIVQYHETCFPMF